MHACVPATVEHSWVKVGGRRDKKNGRRDKGSFKYGISGGYRCCRPLSQKATVRTDDSFFTVRLPMRHKKVFACSTPEKECLLTYKSAKDGVIQILW